MKICMIGTGYVGLVSGVCFADLGNKVIFLSMGKACVSFLERVSGLIITVCLTVGLVIISLLFSNGIYCFL